MKKKLFLMIVVIITIAGSGCLDIFDMEIIQTPTPVPTPIVTPIPTTIPTPAEPEVRTVDITVDYKVKSLGITLYDDSYTYRLENTTMTDDEIRVEVGKKVEEVAQDKKVDMDWVSYECSIESC